MKLKDLINKLNSTETKDLLPISEELEKQITKTFEYKQTLGHKLIEGKHYKTLFKYFTLLEELDKQKLTRILKMKDRDGWTLGHILAYDGHQLLFEQFINLVKAKSNTSLDKIIKYKTNTKHWTISDILEIKRHYTLLHQLNEAKNVEAMNSAFNHSKEKEREPNSTHTKTKHKKNKKRSIKDLEYYLKVKDKESEDRLEQLIKKDPMVFKELLKNCENIYSIWEVGTYLIQQKNYYGFRMFLRSFRSRAPDFRIQFLSFNDYIDHSRSFGHYILTKGDPKSIYYYVKLLNQYFQSELQIMIKEKTNSGWYLADFVFRNYIQSNIEYCSYDTVHAPEIKTNFIFARKFMRLFLNFMEQNSVHHIFKILDISRIRNSRDLLKIEKISSDDYVNLNRHINIEKLNMSQRLMIIRFIIRNNHQMLSTFLADTSGKNNLLLRKYIIAKIEQVSDKSTSPNIKSSFDEFLNRHKQLEELLWKKSKGNEHPLLDYVIKNRFDILIKLLEISSDDLKKKEQIENHVVHVITKTSFKKKGELLCLLFLNNHLGEHFKNDQLIKKASDVIKYIKGLALYPQKQIINTIFQPQENTLHKFFKEATDSGFWGFKPIKELHKMQDKIDKISNEPVDDTSYLLLN